MRVEIVSLTDENLAEAPEWGEHPFSCKYCLYWELEEFSDSSRESRGDMLAGKLNWLRRVGKTFGECGKIVYVDGKPVGYAQYASSLSQVPIWTAQWGRGVDLMPFHRSEGIQEAWARKTAFANHN
jgi:GH25 family lysozyme M1 (1,4-beta-N-acetylmuramidase)